MNTKNKLDNAESKIDKQYENQVQGADNRTYSYQDVANRFIVLFQERKEVLSHKKLQKLVYLVYGFCLYMYNNRLIDERFEAWLHGPVCSELFFAIKNNQSLYNPYDINNILESSKPIASDETGRLFPLVDYIMYYFGNWSGNELENLTYKKGSAWDKVKNSEDNEIFLSDEAIRTEIKAIIEDSI